MKRGTEEVPEPDTEPEKRTHSTSEMTPQPAPAKPTRRARWTRRLVWLCALTIIARVALGFALLPVVRAVAANFGVDLTWERIDLSLHSGRVEIWRLNASVPNGDNSPLPLLEVDTLAIDVDLLALLSGIMRVRRLEVDGVRAHLTRDGEGAWNFDPVLAHFAPDPTKEKSTPEPPKPYEPTPIPHRSPIQVFAARAQDIEVILRDDVGSEPVFVTVNVSVVLADIGVPSRDGRLDVIVTSPQLLDLLRVRARVHTTEEDVALDLNVRLSRLRLGPLKGLLSGIGVEPIAERIDAGLQCNVRVARLATDPNRLEAEVKVSEAFVHHDGDEALALDALDIKVAELWDRGLLIREIEVDGVRGSLEWMTGGGVLFAGVALRGQASQAPSDSGVEAEPEGSQAPAASDDPQGEPSDSQGEVVAQADDTPTFEFGIDTVRVARGRLEFTDRSFDPPVVVHAILDSLNAGPFARDPAHRDGEGAHVSLHARLPGIMESLTVSGRVQSIAPSPRLTLALDAVGLVPERIAPYMALIGLEPVFSDGSFHIDAVEIGGGVGGGASPPGFELVVRGIALQDDGEELGGVDSVEVLLRRDQPLEINVAGVRAVATRTAGNAFEFLGIRVGGSPEPARLPESDGAAVVKGADADEADPASDESTSTSAVAPFAMPRILLPTMSIGVQSLVLIDDSTDASPFGVGPFECNLTQAEAKAADGRAYHLELTGTTRIAKEFSMSIDMEQSAAGRIDLSTNAVIHGADLGHIHEWLGLVGIEPALSDGTLEATLVMAIEAVEGGPRIDLTLGPVLLSDAANGAEIEWLGLDRLEVENLVFDGGVGVDLVRVVRPRIHVERDAEGGVLAFGLRLPPPVLESSSGADASGVKEAGSEPSTPAEAAEQQAPKAGVLRVDKFELVDAVFVLDDRWGDDVHVVEVGADLAIHHLVPGIGAPRTSVNGSVRVGDSTLSVQGDVVLDPRDLHVSIEISGDHLHGGSIGPYLPPGVEIDLTTGVLTGKLTAHVAVVEAGGRSFDLHIEDVDLRERDAERAAFSVSSVRIVAPRIDAEGRVYNIDEISVSGTTLDVVRTAAGGIRTAGIRLTPRAPDSTRSPVEESVAAPAKSSPGRVGAGSEVPPKIRIGRLDLEIADVRVSSEGFEDQPPLLASSRLSLREPYLFDISSFTDTQEDDAPPIGIDFEAAVTPGDLSLKLGIDISPFVSDPSVSARLDIEGISGEALVALVPELAEQVDTSGIVDGTLGVTLDAEVNWRRRGLFDFNLSNGFGLDFVLRDLALRATRDGDIALGVDRVEVAARRLTPRSGRYRFTRVEIVRPRLRVRRTLDGLEVAGVVIHLDDEAAAAEPQASEGGDLPADDAAAAVDEGSVAIAEPAVGPGSGVADSGADRGEIKVDSILIRDVDFVYEDARNDPSFFLPIDTFDLEVKGLSTRALIEPQPVRFFMTVGGGEVSLPVRLESRSLLRGVATGLVSGVSSVVGASEAEVVEYEQRPLFLEASVAGRIVLVPYPAGWIRSSVAGFELLGLRGLAREVGVEIGDGVLDSNVRVRLSGEDGGRVDAVFSFSHLALSEPDGGPISRYLKLPAPLDSVLFVLKNEQGEHRIPLSFSFGGDGRLRTGEIARKASAAFLGLVTEALAAAPMRAVGTVTDVVGLGGLFGGGDRTPQLAGLIAFAEFSAGDTLVGVDASDQIDVIADALKDDPLLVVEGYHVFGAGDLDRAERLATPDSAEAKRLIRSLRQRRRSLTRARDELATAARSQLLLGQTESFSATREQLILADRNLGETEGAIDRVAALLRPGAEHRRDRRTKEAALAVARARLDAVRRKLLQAGISPDRFTLRSPRYELVDISDHGRQLGAVSMITKGGTPPRGLFRRMLAWVGF